MIFFTINYNLEISILNKLINKLLKVYFFIIECICKIISKFLTLMFSFKSNNKEQYFLLISFYNYQNIKQTI